ncbi:MAG TPA: 23S rRNA (pseudouridine(1915)-N(3))-methyltransferase RlmH [Stellaceae bacterium]|nr:23S rRNA (pseudouridine(1915)-N(3))-methyltransferase RlmH [Stellaceae bacterium]
MRLAIIAVGRLKPGPMHDLADEYLKRIAGPVAIREVEERRRLPPAALKEREGALLVEALPRGAFAVALDRGGTSLSSEEFAARLQRWREQGTEELAFLIGGAEGLADAVLAKARFRLALGAMTWPHLLARIMLLEQLYRAQQILAGHPYHRA